MTQQLDMDLDGSRRDLHTLVVALAFALHMMESRMAAVLEALDRCGVTIARHAEYGWQWTLASGMWGRTDTLADAVEAGIYNLIGQ